MGPRAAQASQVLGKRHVAGDGEVSNQKMRARPTMDRTGFPHMGRAEGKYKQKEK
jgi:hypothetical protein